MKISLWWLAKLGAAAIILIALLAVPPIARTQPQVYQRALDAPLQGPALPPKRPVAKSLEVPPILEAIARCESNGEQFLTNGEVVTSPTGDRGKFQINAFYHSARAKRLGMDLDTLEGNTRYALLLYEEEGLRPWRASAHCHGY